MKHVLSAWGVVVLSALLGLGERKTFSLGYAGAWGIELAQAHQWTPSCLAGTPTLADALRGTGGAALGWATVRLAKRLH